MGSRQKVLLVTRNFPPVVGGMERLAHHVYLELKKDFQMSIVGPHGCQNHVAADTKVLSCTLVPTSVFFFCLQWRTFRLARLVKPDLIVAGSGVAAPAALCAARSIGVPAICYLHGLDLVANDSIYRGLFIPFIRRCDKFIVNSRNTAHLAREIGINPDKIEILHPGVVMPSRTLPPRLVSFRERLDAREKIILLSVGRVHPRKGLPEFIRKTLPLLVETIPNLILVLIGEEPRQALKQPGAELQRVLATAKTAGLEQHVKTLGAVDDTTLEMAYRESDLLVFPVLELPGDVEGFGMVAVEAAAHGLLTVAFAAGGVPDAVKEGVSGYLVPPGDYTGFADAVIRCLNEETSGRHERCVEHAREFSWDVFGEKLRKICRKEINGAKGGTVAD